MEQQITTAIGGLVVLVIGAIGIWIKNVLSMSVKNISINVKQKEVEYTADAYDVKILQKAQDQAFEDSRRYREYIEIELNQYKTQFESANKQRYELAERLVVVERKLDGKNAQEEKLNVKIKELEVELNSVREALEKVTESNTILMGQITTSNIAIAVKDKEIAEKDATIQALKTQVEQLNSHIEQLNIELKGLQQIIATMQELNGDQKQQ